MEDQGQHAGYRVGVISPMRDLGPGIRQIIQSFVINRESDRLTSRGMDDSHKKDAVVIVCRPRRNLRRVSSICHEQMFDKVIE